MTSVAVYDNNNELWFPKPKLLCCYDINKIKQEWETWEVFDVNLDAWRLLYKDEFEELQGIHLSKTITFDRIKEYVNNSINLINVALPGNEQTTHGCEFHEFCDHQHPTSIDDIYTYGCHFFNTLGSCWHNHIPCATAPVIEETKVSCATVPVSLIDETLIETTAKVEVEMSETPKKEASPGRALLKTGSLIPSQSFQQKMKQIKMGKTFQVRRMFLRWKFSFFLTFTLSIMLAAMSFQVKTKKKFFGEWKKHTDENIYNRKHRAFQIWKKRDNGYLQFKTFQIHAIYFRNSLMCIQHCNMYITHSLSRIQLLWSDNNDLFFKHLPEFREFYGILKQYTSILFELWGHVGLSQINDMIKCWVKLLPLVKKKLWSKALSRWIVRKIKGRDYDVEKDFYKLVVVIKRFEFMIEFCYNSLKCTLHFARKYMKCYPGIYKNTCLNELVYHIIGQISGEVDDKEPLFPLLFTESRFVKDITSLWCKTTECLESNIKNPTYQAMNDLGMHNTYVNLWQPVAIKTITLLNNKTEFELTTEKVHQLQSNVQIYLTGSKKGFNVTIGESNIISKKMFRFDINNMDIEDVENLLYVVPFGERICLPVLKIVSQEEQLILKKMQLKEIIHSPKTKKT